MLILGKVNSSGNFSFNSAGLEGGAIYSEFSTVEIGGCSNFSNNLLTLEDTLSHGSALSIVEGNFNTASFHNNKARSTKSYGGAISLLASDALFSVGEFDFQNNSAVTGGGIYSN